MINHRILVVGLTLIGATLTIRAGALEMPKEIANTAVGMSIADLIKTRPDVKFPGAKGPVDPLKIGIGKITLLEQLDGSGGFHTVGYWIEDGRVSVITLLGTAARGEERGGRRMIIKDCIQRWGKKFIKRAPENRDAPGTAEPKLTWEIDDVEIILDLPRNLDKGHKGANNFGLSFRSLSVAKKKPWKADMSMSAADKKEFLKSHDIDD